MNRTSKLSEALTKIRERSSGKFLPFFKFPSGKTIIRILPASPKDDAGDWFLPVGFHYNVDEKRPITCRYETQWAGDECPVCNMVRELRGDNMNDEANKIGLRRQFIVRAIIRGEEAKGAQMVRLPSTLFDAIGEIIKDEETFGDVLHPGPAGRDIIVVKSGQGLGTEYQANAHPKNVPALATPEEVKALISSFPPISSLVTIPTKEEVEGTLKAKFGYVSAMGSVYDEDEDEEAEDTEEWGTDDEDEDEDTPQDEDWGITRDDDEEEDELDAWMKSDEEEEDDDEVTVADLAKAAQESKVSGLQEDMEKKKNPSKKGRSRTKKLQPEA